jgi:predicted helicase
MALWESDVAKTNWEEVKPTQPNFFFVPKKNAGAEDYNSYRSLAEVFQVFGNGIGTDRDSLFYDFEKDMLDKRMQEFYTPAALESRFRNAYRVENSSSYNLLRRRQNTNFSSSAIRQCLYRPFDTRWLYYDPKLVSRPGFDVMSHLLQKNLGLLVTRQVAAGDFHHAFVTEHLIDRDPLSLITRERTQVFPLYVYPEKTDLLAAADRHPNLSPQFLMALTEKLKLPQTEPHGLPKGISPEDIFNYAYAIFHSPTYRTRYVEFLKIDFPRLPLTSNLKLFRALAVKGADLVAFHLLESPKLHDFITAFPEKGDNVVEKVQYTEKDKRVWFNKTQYFESVPKKVWEFRVGGYRVCEKWLKDRKERPLSYDDTQHYQKIVVALNETIRLMAEIDQLIPSWPIK